jgi:hypothetical protein
LQDNRREFSDNEKQLLFDEVHGRCPFCGKRLTHQKDGRVYKTFEIAHIYPANPRDEEVTLLNNEERLSEDVNDIKNVIAACRICHKMFDTPRTVEEYHSWMKLKRKLLQDNALKDCYALFNVESEINTVLGKLNTSSIEENLIPLSLDSLKIEEKANSSLPYAIKRSIKNDVVDYFDYIQRNFIELDKVTPYKFSTVAAQIKSFYSKCMQINNDQGQVYYALVDWLDEKTGHYSRRACEIVISFFVQDCEVFS